MANNSRIYLDEDTRLMLQVGKGDARAFEKVYRKYFPVITSYFASLNGHLTSPEDLTQEVFVRIWRRRAEYHPNATVKTYLFSYSYIIHCLFFIPPEAYKNITASGQQTQSDFTRQKMSNDAINLRI